MDEWHVGERTPRPTNGPRSGGNGITGNRITNGREMTRFFGVEEEARLRHNNSSIWLMDVQGRKKQNECRGQVFAATNTSQICKMIPLAGKHTEGSGFYPLEY